MELILRFHRKIQAHSCMNITGHSCIGFFETFDYRFSVFRGFNLSTGILVLIAKSILMSPACLPLLPPRHDKHWQRPISHRHNHSKWKWSYAPSSPFTTVWFQVPLPLLTKSMVDDLSTIRKWRRYPTISLCATPTGGCGIGKIFIILS